MKRQIFPVSAIVITAMAAIYMLTVAMPGWEMARALNESRSTIARQAQELEAQVDRTLADGWREVAEDYLSQYELGRIDEKMDSIGDYHSQWNHSNAAAEIHSTIYETVQAQLIQDGDFPVTNVKVRERIRSNHQADVLWQLVSESGDLPSMRADALVAIDLEQCAKIQKKLEERRQAVLLLLAKVSRW